MYINNLGHMTKMAAMPIYGKNPSKIIFSETNRLISRKLGVRHRWLKYSNVYINHDPVMTLTKFMARSTWVACASELGKLLKCHLKEKANRKLANGQNIEDSEKRKWPKGLSAPALELNTIIFKHVYWYMQLISGERLQDHWSSGFFFIFAQNIDCGYTLEPPLCFGANPCIPQFCYIKLGFNGVYITRTCFRDGFGLFWYLRMLSRSVLRQYLLHKLYSRCCVTVYDTVFVVVVVVPQLELMYPHIFGD